MTIHPWGVEGEAARREGIGGKGSGKRTENERETGKRKHKVKKAKKSVKRIGEQSLKSCRTRKIRTNKRCLDSQECSLVTF